MFENNGYINAYSPVTGRQPPEANFFINSIIQSIQSFAASFPQLNYLVTVFPFQMYR